MSIHFPKWCKTKDQKSRWASMVASIRWARHHDGQDVVQTEPDLPDLVRRITIEDFAAGSKHVFDLHTCTRIDQYRVLVNGRPWKDRAGLSVILAGLRKAWGRYSRIVL